MPEEDRDWNAASSAYHGDRYRWKTIGIDHHGDKKPEVADKGGTAEDYDEDPGRNSHKDNQS